VLVRNVDVLGLQPQLVLPQPLLQLRLALPYFGGV
jgi:hypothetical protein